MREIEAQVRRNLGERVVSSLSATELVDEIERLADPWAVPGLDVVIPGTRTDLVERWAEARLTGRGVDEADWMALAREIAPLPDQHLIDRGTDASGESVFQSVNKRQDEITAAAKAHFERKRRREA